MKPRRVEVHDRMQHGYVYQVTEPPGWNFHPASQPEPTPDATAAAGTSPAGRDNGKPSSTGPTTRDRSDPFAVA